MIQRFDRVLFNCNNINIKKIYLKVFLMTCKLISTELTIPHQEIQAGQTLILGRNRQCKIKNIKCPRKFCTVQLKDNGLYVHYSKNDSFKLCKSGEFLEGPGFRYKVHISPLSTDVTSNVAALSVDSNSCSDIIWSDHDSGKVIIGHYKGSGNPSARIAAFDYDFTLVGTKSDKTFPINAQDWKLFDPKLPEYIKKLVDQGYRFVVFSNQLGVSKGKLDVKQLKTRLNESIKKINVPCLILLAIEDDIYRKPRVGLWQYFQKTVQPDLPVEKENSFYVGDAAGRKKTSIQKGDHSSGDLLFAANCGLKFMVPEQFFLTCKNDTFKIRDMTESLLPKGCFKFKRSDQTDHVLVNVRTGKRIADISSVLPSAKHCIMFCGIAGSGKSTFYENYLKKLGYVHINMDTLKSQSKCVSLANKSLSESRNCVIDNTNVDKATRAKWVEVCRQHNTKLLIFHFDLPVEHILHNSKYRKLTSDISTPSVVIYSQRKKLEPPTSDECDALFTVNFVAKFVDSEQQQLYSMYLSEK